MHALNRLALREQAVVVQASFGACHARNEIMFAMRQHDATGNVTRGPTSPRTVGTVSRS